MKEAINSLHFEIEIDQVLRRVAPELKLGLVIADMVEVKKDDETWKELKEEGEQVKSRISIEDLTEEESIKAARAVYRQLGKDPSRYRVSSEALIRRILQGKGLYQVNNVVDVNNIVSVRSTLSVGSYNLDNLVGKVSFRVGGEGESYKGIGKDSVNIEGLPVFVDGIGAFGSPTADSERAMISSDTKRIMMVLISFAGDMRGKLETYTDSVAFLLKKHTSAKVITTKTI